MILFQWNIFYKFSNFEMSNFFQLAKLFLTFAEWHLVKKGLIIVL